MYKVTLYNRRSYPNNGQVLLDTSSGTNPGIASAMVDSKLNEAGSFTFTIVSSHPLYEDASLVPMKGYVSVEDDGDEIFWGRIITIQKNPLSGSKQITCEGALAFMLDAELPIDTEAVSMSAADYFEYCVNKYNTQIGTDAARNILVGEIDIDEADEVHEYKNTEYTQIQSVMKSKLIDCVNGFIHIWRDPNTKKHYIDWTAESGAENPQAVKIKENVVNQTSKESGDDIYTKIRAVGSKSGDTRPELQPVALDSGMVNDYGTIIRTVTFGEATTAEALQSELNTYISQIRERLSLSGEINFVDLHFLDEEETKVMCGDIFTNIVGYPNKRLIAGSLSRDLLNPANDKISLNSEKDVRGKLNAIGANSGISSGASSSSGKGRSLSSGGSNWYKHIHETDETLSLTAKQLEVTASKVTAIIGDADITVTTLSSLSGRVTTQEGKWTSFEGTQLYQDQSHIATIAGNFSVDSQTGYMRLNEGAQFDISPTGVNSNVGKLVYSHDGRQKEIGELLMAYEGSYVYQHNDDISGIVGRYQVRTSLNPEQPYVAVSAPATEAEKALLNDSGGPAGRNYYEYNSKKDEYFKSTDTTYNDKKTYYKLNYIVDGVTFDAGGGFEIKEDNVAYGIWHEGKLSAGMFVSRGQNQKTYTHIRGDHVKIGGDNSDSVELSSLISTVGSTIFWVKSQSAFGKDPSKGLVISDTGKLDARQGIEVSNGSKIIFDPVADDSDPNPGSSISIDYNDVYGFLKDVTIVGSGNNYKLLSLANGTTAYVSNPTYDTHTGWSEAGTFSRAISSWTGGWANGIYTATANPQNQSTVTTLAAITADGNAYLSKGIVDSNTGLYVENSKGKYVVRNFSVDYAGTLEDETIPTGFEQQIILDASRVYNNGSSDVNLTASWTKEPTYDAVSHNHNKITVETTGRVNSSGTAANLQRGFDIYVASDDNVAYAKLASASGQTIAQITHNKYNSGWGAAQVDSSMPTATGSTASITVKIPSSTVGVHLTKTYELYSQTNNQVVLRYNSAAAGQEATYTTVAAITHNKYTNGRKAATIVMDDFTLDTLPSMADYTSQTSRVLTAHAHNNYNTVRTGSKDTTLSLSANKLVVTLKQDGTAIAQITADGSEEFTKGQNDIINAGGAYSQSGPCTNKSLNQYVTTLTVTNATSASNVAFDSSYIPSGETEAIKVVKPVTSGGYPFLRIWARDNGLTGSGGDQSRTIDVFAGSSPVETLSITDYKSGWDAGGGNARIRWVQGGKNTSLNPGTLDHNNTYAVCYTNSSGTVTTNKYWYVPASTTPSDYVSGLTKETDTVKTGVQRANNGKKFTAYYYDNGYISMGSHYWWYTDSSDYSSNYYDFYWKEK